MGPILNRSFSNYIKLYIYVCISRKIFRLVVLDVTQTIVCDTNQLHVIDKRWLSKIISPPGTAKLKHLFFYINNVKKTPKFCPLCVELTFEFTVKLDSIWWKFKLLAPK